MNNSWVKQFDCAVTVCDTNGIILEMNDKALKTFSKYGGAALIGKNLFDCHSESSQKKLKEMIQLQKKNVYTIEKEGIKKMIYQAPWYENDVYKGFVEISLEIPMQMEHFIRN